MMILVLLLGIPVWAGEASCSIELKQALPGEAARMQVSGGKLTDGTRSLELSAARAQELCNELNAVVWKARRKGRAKCVPFARILVGATREDYQLCERPQELRMSVLAWMKARDEQLGK